MTPQPGSVVALDLDWRVAKWCRDHPRRARYVRGAGGSRVAALLGQLTVLGALEGTDKALPHRYTAAYRSVLAPWRWRPVSLLEIGVGGEGDVEGGGRSLHMWLRYFPRGQVTGVDIEPKRLDLGLRGRTIVADQSDGPGLADACRPFAPFDVIIDDGSHQAGHVVTSLEALFPLLRPGGCYFVEDLHTSFWPGWGGGVPPGPDTGVGLAERAVVAVQAGDAEHADAPGGAFDTLPVDGAVVEARCWPGLLMVRKAWGAADGGRGGR